MTSIKTVIKLCKQGFRPNEITRRHPDVSASVVSVTRMVLGLKKLPRGRKAGDGLENSRTPKLRQAALELRELGWTLDQIGRELGVSRQYVHQIIAP